MRRSREPRENSSSPSTSKMSGKGESGHSRVDSSSRSQTSSYRRSRTPRRKKSLSPPKKRSKVSRSERPSSRSRRTERMSKRRRASTRSRSCSRHKSKDKRPSHSSRSRHRDLNPAKVASKEPKGQRNIFSAEACSAERPPYRGPDKERRYGIGSLKKIIVNMKGTSEGSDKIKREIVNPEGITVVRRAGEGSRPIFDRDEIKNSKRKHEEDEHYARRYLSDSPPHSGRRLYLDERFRSRDSYYEEERRVRHRDPSTSRPKEYGTLSHERHRDERSRYVRRTRSRERSREYVHERRERYDDSEYATRASLRSYRRHPSPLEIRRINGRRLRSPERGELTPRPRENEGPPEGEYPAPEYPAEGHYYEGEAVESPMLPASRGGVHPLPFRARGAGIPLVRPGEVLIRGGPPVRPLRTVFFPRVPGMGRRLPFPPRLIRPIVRPVIRVIAPVIPVRSPPVIPVRHPVIPLPFQ